MNWFSERLWLEIGSEVIGSAYNADSEIVIVGRLFASVAFFRSLEILTPGALTYAAIDGGERMDLLEHLEACVRGLTTGCWHRFIAKTDNRLMCWASNRMNTACLQRDPERARGLLNEFRDLLRQGHDKPSVVTLCTSGEAWEQLESFRGTVEELTIGDIDSLFNTTCEVLRHLSLSTACYNFFAQMFKSLATAFAKLDGSLSDADKRYLHHFEAQVNVTLSKYIADHESNQTSGMLNEDSYEAVVKELQVLIGLNSVKQRLTELANFARVQQMRAKQGLGTIKPNYHTVYTGNPGTGKTTVARIMGRMYKALGVLAKGHVVECDRSKLVAEYVGQTAVKTNAVIDTAIDGILFIDEAYALAQSREWDFGKEAIETLLKRMEDNRERLIVIVAGYNEEMIRFINSNPGLKSRFTNYVTFPDYTPQELCSIFTSTAKQQQFTCSPQLREKLLVHCTLLHESRDEHFGNGRVIRNLFEAALIQHSTRLSSSGDFSTKALTQIEADDFKSAYEEVIKAALPTKTHETFLVKCPHCNHANAWNSEHIEHECSRCGKKFDGEFGEWVPPEAL